MDYQYVRYQSIYLNKAVNSLRFYLSKKNVILITSTKQRHLYKNHLREINYENYQYCCCCYGSFNSVIWRVRGGTGNGIPGTEHVSADGASTLDALEAKLAEKAAAAGASGYSITSATNNNKLSGTAVIYK